MRGGVIPKLFDWIFPIGSVIANANSAFDPNVIYKHQTWVRWAKGRTLVGIDEDDTDFATVDKTGGEKTHTLTVSEMPSHTHRSASSANGAIGDYFGGSNANYGIQHGSLTPANASYVINSNAAGGGSAHNNLQPYTTVYYWKRTA